MDQDDGLCLARLDTSLLAGHDGPMTTFVCTEPIAHVGDEHVAMLTVGLSVHWKRTEEN